jgi:DNA polymerase II large subunit
VAVLGDYVRRLLGLEAYRARDEEVSRFIEELRLYEREVSRFQFHVDDETLTYVLHHLPVEVTGIRTDPVEVADFRNIPGIETNAVRGGALRVVNDGIVGRASKVWKVVRELNLTGWDWLRKITASRSEEEAESPYLHDIIAGRPVFSFPSTSKYGSRFRLRYGRARNTGLTSVGVHPATMTVLGGFMAVGTQLRLEFPEKGGIVSAVDTVEPPVVRLKSGSVVRVETVEKAQALKGEVDKILFLGDLLISFSEFLENGKPLAPSGFVEEWWAWELKKALGERGEETAGNLGIPYLRLQSLADSPLAVKPSAAEAIKISSKLGVPLHPRYTYFWRNICLEEFLRLRSRLAEGEIETRGELAETITLDLDAQVKTIFERLLLPHRVEEGKLIAADGDAAALAWCLGLNREIPRLEQGLTVLQAVSVTAGFEVRDKYSCFVGARMGRPEKAAERKMKPPVHVLFPVGLSGGAQRNLVEGAGKAVNVELVKRKCGGCGGLTPLPFCPSCGSKTSLHRFCPRCRRPLSGDRCAACGVEGRFYERQNIDLEGWLKEASSRLGMSLPQLVKGVKGLMNETRIPEPLEKGLLRAKYGLTVFKDGTVRYDLTNAPLTHFRPSEVGVSAEDLRRLGYTVDREGRPLTGPDQLCELKVQDIVISEKCGDYLVRVAGFVDELLQRFYGLPRFYNAQERRDLLGHLVVGLSPHTSAGVLGRIVGFSKLNVCYAHPLWISAKRRDCDGDEDCVMLALDAFLNFSRDYLPAQIGGIMDAPLLLTPLVNPLEVDDQVWSLDLSHVYPLEFFQRTWEKLPPRFVMNLLDMVQFRLGNPAQYEGYGFSHEVSDINSGVGENVYKKLGTMEEKLRQQMALMEKIEGVDVKDVAKRVLAVHFMRDIVGNLKVFASQAFRCKKCNAKHRRIPLRGRCSKCGGEISLTVYKGSVEKYLKVAEWLAETYGIKDYYRQRIEVVSEEIAAVFSEGEGEAGKKTLELTEFM